MNDDNHDRTQELRKARAMAYFAIAETQEASGIRNLPLWFRLNTNMTSEWKGEHILNLLFYVFFNPVLAANQSFEEINGIKTLVETDPHSGEKAYVILHGMFEDNRVDLFEMEIDLLENRAVVDRATDLRAVKTEDLFLPITAEAFSATEFEQKCQALEEKCLAFMEGLPPTVIQAK